MPHIHWVARQNKLEIPRNKDEVKQREIRESDGQAHDPDTMKDSFLKDAWDAKTFFFSTHFKVSSCCISWRGSSSFISSRASSFCISASASSLCVSATYSSHASSQASSSSCCCVGISGIISVEERASSASSASRIACAGDILKARREIPPPTERQRGCAPASPVWRSLRRFSRQMLV